MKSVAYQVCENVETNAWTQVWGDVSDAVWNKIHTFHKKRLVELVALKDSLELD